MKSIFASKTFWVNAVSAVVALLESQDVLNVIPDQYETTIASIVFAINIVLRYITTQPVSLTAPVNTGEV